MTSSTDIDAGDSKNAESSAKPDYSSRPEKIKTYLMLHAILLLYSLGGICSKMAAANEFLSLPFILWYGGVLLELLVYAFFWQKVLKRLPLTTAYANKGVTIIWGVLWGVLLFNETFAWNMIPGAILVFVGIWLVVTSENG